MMIGQILERNRVSPVVGGLYFLDQEKAYDRVDWGYLKKCLEKFGFGPKWLHMVSILYGKLRARLLVNGFQSVAFDINQGVRQGDPLSPLLFNIAIEPLLSLFRQKLSGILLPGLSFKISAFADDVVLGLGSSQDVDLALECLDAYASASNAKLNVDKCQTLVLGGGGDVGLPVIGQLLEPDAVLTHLGIPFHAKCFPLSIPWFEKLLTSLSFVISNWQKRHISMIGRIHVLNSRLLSKLWYLSYFVSWPPWFLKRLKQLVTTFLWDGKRPQVAYATLCGAKEDGGLGLIDPGSQAMALKGWWLQRMSQPNQPPWLALALDNFKHRFAPKGWTISLLLTNTSSRALRYHGLWSDIYKVWQELEGVSLQDPLAFDDDDPLQSALVAGKDISSYTIRSGRLFLIKKSFPATENKWLQVVPELSGRWDTIWRKFKAVRKFLPPRQTLFWWRFLQHNLMTGVRLHHMNPAASEMCHLCDSDRETLDHLFWKCNKVRQFWGYVFQLVKHLVPGCQVPDPKLEVIINPFCAFSDSLFPIVVSVYGTALWSIWKLYLGVVFEGKHFDSVTLKGYFMSLLSDHVSALYNGACKRGGVVKFVKLWVQSPLVCIQDGKVRVQMHV
jgi:hypothetical protein